MIGCPKITPTNKVLRFWLTKNDGEEVTVKFVLNPPIVWDRRFSIQDSIWEQIRKTLDRDTAYDNLRFGIYRHVVHKLLDPMHLRIHWISQSRDDQEFLIKAAFEDKSWRFCY